MLPASAPLAEQSRCRPRAIWIFLGTPGFRFESPFDPCWISLDFLGFLRPNRDFSMGYGRLPRERYFLTLILKDTLIGVLILPSARLLEGRQCVGQRRS